MEGFMDSGTQTDAVVVLSLAQAAVLGLVSENELFGATISAEAFYPDLGPELSGAAMGEPGPPGPEVYQLACNGRALEEPAEEEVLEVEAAFEKHTRRKTRPPVRLVPKVKFEKVEEEEQEVYEVSVPGDDKEAGPAEAPTEAASGGKQHSLTHKGVKEFKCEVCGREFTLQANMKRHMLIHTSVRPYQCHICFKTFVQKQTLKTHMIVHSPVKPFKCKVCGKSFNRMYNLLGHMHLHAGSKPFKCPYCSSKFNLKGNLSRHMKVKHGVMDIGLDSQDPMMELTGTDPSELDGQQEMEDFEENAYSYASVDSSAEASVLTEQAMKEMAYYNVL
uniref:Zinc finger protein 710 n=1 Tax=Cercocebus atys TaxID=9531 RepID=A0A2K5N5F8_CERAT